MLTHFTCKFYSQSQLCVYMCMCIACMGCGINTFVSACVYCSSLHTGTYTNIQPPPTCTHSYMCTYTHLGMLLGFALGLCCRRNWTSSGKIGITTESGKVLYGRNIRRDSRVSVFCTSTLWSVIAILYSLLCVYTKSISKYVQVPKTIFVMLIGIYLSLQNYTIQNLLKVFA